jgi:hypothetical protein
MKLSRFMGISLLLLVLPACHAVYVDEPIGETPLVLDPEEWEGTWLLAEAAVVVDVVDKEEGLLRVAWVEKGFSGDTGLETAIIQLRGGDDWVFGTLLEYDSEEAEGDEFPWGIVKQSDGQILILFPATEKFRALVEAGVLPGRVDGENVYLGPLESEHLARILSEEHPFLFDFDNFGAAARIVR